MCKRLTVYSHKKTCIDSEDDENDENVTKLQRSDIVLVTGCSLMAGYIQSQKKLELDHVHLILVQ